MDETLGREKKLKMIEEGGCAYHFDGRVPSELWLKDWRINISSNPYVPDDSEVESVGKRVLEHYQKDEASEETLRRIMGEQIRRGDANGAVNTPCLTSYQDGYREFYAVASHVEDDGIHLRIAGASRIFGS